MKRALLLVLLFASITFSQRIERPSQIRPSVIRGEHLADTTLTWSKTSAAFKDSARVHKIAGNLYEVAKSGRAYTTVASAISAASAGDVVYLHPGYYSENITLADGVNLVGAGTDSVTIAGSVTTAGRNQIIGVKMGTLTVGTGDTVTVKNSKIYKSGTYTLTMSAGEVDLENVDFVFNTSEPSMNISGGTLRINGGKVYGQKIAASAGTILINNADWTFVTSGNYAWEITGTATVKVENSKMLPVDSNNDYSVTSGIIDIEVENTARLEIRNTRYDQAVTLDDSAKFYADDWTAKYMGRIGTAGTATNQCSLIVRNSNLHMDNGFQSGSHIIESSSGSAAVVDIANSTLEYMGDQGEYPMVGSLSAGGGQQIWTDVLLIDHGGAAGGYTISCYSMEDALLKNVTFISADTTVGKTQRAFGWNTANTFTKFIASNLRIYFLHGYESEREGFLVTTTSRRIKSTDNIFIDLDIVGSSLTYGTSNMTEAAFIDTLKLAAANITDWGEIRRWQDVYYYNDLTIDSSLTVNNNATLLGTFAAAGPRHNQFSQAKDNVILSYGKDTLVTTIAAGDSAIVQVNYQHSPSYRGNWADIEIHYKVNRDSDWRFSLIGKVEIYQLTSSINNTNSTLVNTVLFEPGSYLITDPVIEHESNTNNYYQFKVRNDNAYSLNLYLWMKPSLNVDPSDPFSFQ